MGGDANIPLDSVVFVVLGWQGECYAAYDKQYWFHDLLCAQTCTDTHSHAHTGTRTKQGGKIYAMQTKRATTLLE